MISIRYDRNGVKLWFSGHAGYAEHGKDIVCAAVSALHDTLAANMHTFAGRMSGDNDHFVWAIADIATMREVFDAFVIGFKLIAKQYPDHVTFEEIVPKVE